MSNIILPKFSDWKKNKLNESTKKIGDIDRQMLDTINDEIQLIADKNNTHTEPELDAIAKKVCDRRGVKYDDYVTASHDAEFLGLKHPSKTNESAGDFEILVTFATKDVIEDDFEDGEIGGGQTHDLPHAETIYKDFASICSTLGLSDDISKWYCVDDRIIHSRMEDADNNEVLPTDGSYELWKSKKMKLYSVDYDLSIKFIPKTSPTEDDIEKNLGIKPS